MRALSFLEWVLENSVNNMTVESKVLKVANFYSQPFTVDMLVNPNNIKVEYNGKTYQAGNDIWIESKSLRLFDGWKFQGAKDPHDNNWKYKSGRIDLDIYYDNHNNWIVYDMSGNDNCMKIKTLNDLITFCKAQDINLRWNKSNIKIKELFGGKE